MEKNFMMAIIWINKRAFLSHLRGLEDGFSIRETYLSILYVMGVKIE